MDHVARGGLATSAFIHVFDMYPSHHVSYRELLLNMDLRIKHCEQQAMHAQNSNNGVILRQFNRWPWRAPQRPMLSSNFKINIDEPVRL